MKTNQRQGSENRVLSDGQISQVHEFALRVMEEIGCKVSCDEARDILALAGCDTSDPSRIRIPQRVVMDAIQAAPKRVDVYDRAGEQAMVLEKDACYYGTGSDCPTTIDLYSGERRPSLKQDVADLARFCDALPNVDFVMSFGIATDAPGSASFVSQYEAMLLNTTKPVIVTGHGKDDMIAMAEMAAAAVGGREELHRKPPLILYTEPISPLTHTEMGVSKGLVCCEYGIPVIYIGSPMMGGTGPSTIEGTLVQAVAECLTGLVIFQNKQPGAKFMFGGDATVMDMRTTIFSYGAPELNILNAALADMAHFYELPFFCIAGATDAKRLDAQAGLEYALSLYVATLNGCNIIHDCGYLEQGLTSSFESVLFADEIISLVKHMMRSLEFNEETVPLAVMDRVGPEGSFLLEDHTVETFKNVFWFPRFLDRERFDVWREAGGKSLLTRLNEEARRIFESHHPQRMPEEVIARIRELAEDH